jgi:transposase
MDLPTIDSLLSEAMDAFGSANAERLGSLVERLALATRELAQSLIGERERHALDVAELRGQVGMRDLEIAELKEAASRRARELGFLRTKVFGSTSEKSSNLDTFKAAATSAAEHLDDDDAGTDAADSGTVESAGVTAAAGQAAGAPDAAEDTATAATAGSGTVGSAGVTAAAGQAAGAPDAGEDTAKEAAASSGTTGFADVATAVGPAAGAPEAAEDAAKVAAMSHADAAEQGPFSGKDAAGEQGAAASGTDGKGRGGGKRGSGGSRSARAKARRAMRGGRQQSQKLALSSTVRRLIVEHPVPKDLGLVCALCNTPATDHGTVAKAREIDLEPSQVVEKTHRLHEAKCLCGALRFQMPGPARGADQTIFSPAFVARVITDKFVSFLPCYRQAKRLKSQGVTIDYRRLNGLVVLAWLALAPLVNRIRELNRQQAGQSVDESPIRVVIDGVKEVRYLWCLVTNLAVTFVATPNRNKKTAREVVGGTTAGTLTSDRLSIYHDLFEEKAEVGCMAHCRRYYWYALPTAETEALAVIEKIKELYAVEDDAKNRGLDAAARLALRQEKSIPLMAELRQLIESLEPPPRSALGRAKGYALGNWPPLMYFTTDGSVEIDNNVTEGELRDPKLGQKNYLFSQCEDGVAALAGHYTLARTVLMYGHDPDQYYTDVLGKLNAGWPAARLDELLPWNWRPPDTVAAPPPAKIIVTRLAEEIRTLPRVRARLARLQAQARGARSAAASGSN